MADGVEVQGVDQLVALAQTLRTVGDVALKKELRSGLTRAARSLIKNVRRSALTRLPKKGGLAKRVARSKITTSARTTGSGAGVTILARSGYDISSINRGRVRHLSFGHLPWVDQSVSPGFWADPLNEAAIPVRHEIQKLMDDIAAKITS
jgi:hypothetical protein